MAGWAIRRHTISDTSASARAVALLVLLTASITVYVGKHPAPLSLSTVVGTSVVIDGDTIAILSTRIRLHGIDAPELKQTCTDAQGRPWPCGNVSAQELRRHINGRNLRCEPTRFDQYKRMLATCFAPDGTDVNAWMVRHGWALAYRNTTRYRSEQKQAARAKRGLWAGAFTPPWKWREARRSKTDAH